MNDISCLKIIWFDDIYIYISILIFVNILFSNSIVVIHGAYQLVIDVLCDLEGHVNYQRPHPSNEAFAFGDGLR